MSDICDVCGLPISVNDPSGFMYEWRWPRQRHEDARMFLSVHAGCLTLAFRHFRVCVLDAVRKKEER